MMQHDETEDEYGFWEPASRRHVLRRRADHADTGVTPGGEPTRQLQRIDPDRRSDHTAELRRLQVSGRSDPVRREAPRGPGQIPAIDLVGEQSEMAAAEVARYLDGDLDDETYFKGHDDATNAAGPNGGRSRRVPWAGRLTSDSGVVPVVASTGHARRTWRTLLTRDERGRLDPLVTRLSAIAVVGALALTLSVATNSSRHDPQGSAAVRPAAVLAAHAAGGPVVATEVAVTTTVIVEPSTGVAAAVPSVEDAPGTSTAADTAAGSARAAVPAPSSAPATVSASSAPSAARSGSATSGAGATPQALAGPPACGPDYTVAAGDYWIGIAGRADVALSDLLDANSAEPGTALFPGRTICLPAGTAPLAPAAKVTTTTGAPTTVAPPSTPAPTVAPATTPPATRPAVAKPAPAKPATTKPAATTPVTTTPATTTPATTTPAPTKPAPTVPATAPTTTVPATTAPAIPATPPTTTPARTYSRAEVEQIIRNTWPDDQEDRAVQIATRESNLVPGVRNYCCYGLFQIYYDVHRAVLNQIGVISPEQLFDPAVNALAALVLYNRAGGWGPWAL